MLSRHMTTTPLAGCNRQDDSRVCKQCRTYCPETVEMAPQMEVKRRGEANKMGGGKDSWTYNKRGLLQ